MHILGVFETIYGAGAEMTIGRALLISAVGFLIVFLILGVLALFVKTMGATMDKLTSKKSAKNTIVAREADESPTPDSAGTPLPSNVSAGSLKLTDVTEAEAAIIMAIVSHQSGIPLNRLQFNSIKLKEDN